LPPDDKHDRKNRSRRLQERLLGYQTGKFEDDPFRHVALADAQPDDNAQG
jgi:CRISPR-associated protein Csm5